MKRVLHLKKNSLHQTAFVNTPQSERIFPTTDGNDLFDCIQFNDLNDKVVAVLLRSTMVVCAGSLSVTSTTKTSSSPLEREL